jgi:hypothetical protein
MQQIFKLAPMSGVIRVMTYVFLAMPVAFVAFGTRDGPGSAVLSLTGMALALLWLVIWVYSRPTRFELGADELKIVWPVRRRSIPLSDIVMAESIPVPEFKKRYGHAMRIGVGGMWGVFGWLWSRRSGFMDVYASRIDEWVVIERRSGRLLLISPDRASEFLAALDDARSPMHATG